MLPRAGSSKKSKGALETRLHATFFPKRLAQRFSYRTHAANKHRLGLTAFATDWWANGLLRSVPEPSLDQPSQEHPSRQLWLESGRDRSR